MRARARRRRRRHLARQHLPGLRLRRALAPLLVLLRAEPGLEPHLLAASPRSATTCARVADELRRAAARALRPRAGRGAPGTRTRSAGRSRPRRARSRADVAGLRHRAALSRAADPGHPGPRRASRARRSTRRAGTTTSTSTGKRVAVDRHRRLGDPVRAARSSRRSGSCTSSSAPRRGSCPSPTAPITPREQRLYRRFPPLSARCAALIYWARELLVLGFVKHPRADAARRADAPAPPASSRSPTRELRDKLTPSYTIGCKRILLSERLVPAARSGRTSSWSPTAIAEITPNGDRAPPTATEHEVDAIIFGTGFHVTDMPIGRSGCAGADGRDARRGLGGQPAGLPGHDRRGLPEPVHAARAEHRPRAQLDGLHDRVAGRLRAGRAAPHGRARRRRRRGAAARSQARLQRRASSERMQGTVWNTAAARAGTSTRRAATPTLWPDWTWPLPAADERVRPADYALSTHAGAREAATAA